MNMQSVWEIVKGKRIIGMEITETTDRSDPRAYTEPIVPTVVTFRLDDGSSLVIGTKEIQDYETWLNIQAFGPVKADGKTVWKMEYYE